METKVLYIVNPTSGSGEGNNEAAKLLKKQFADFEWVVKETTGQDDERWIRDLLRYESWLFVLVGGGDGTVNLVAGLLAGTGIPLGIVPLGTSNGMASCLGIHQLDFLFEAIRKHQTILTDMMQINEKHSFHLCDFGFNANLIKRMKNQSENGMLSFFKSSLQEFLQMKPYRFSLVLDEHKTEQVEANMLVIANGNQYGTGALINPKSQLDDGLVELIALSPDSLTDILAISLAFFRGTLDTLDAVKTWQVRQVKIINQDGAGFHVDGEYAGETKHVTCKCLPSQVHFFFNQV